MNTRGEMAGDWRNGLPGVLRPPAITRLSGCTECTESANALSSWR